METNRNEGGTTMLLTIHGPNLSAAAQAKGSFHVHTADCQDNRNYGPRGKFHGEDNGWTLECENALAVSAAMYIDHLSDYGLEAGTPEADEMLESYLCDFHFAPCVKGLEGLR